jgi:phosphoribosylformimino-5-aminoimidazole carboxamide ribonucleotide (ProFAR) isomerase
MVSLNLECASYALEHQSTLIEGASEEASKVLDLAGGIREQATREHLLGVLLAAQAT